MTSSVNELLRTERQRESDSIIGWITWRSLPYTPTRKNALNWNYFLFPRKSSLIISWCPKQRAVKIDDNVGPCTFSKNWGSKKVRKPQSWLNWPRCQQAITTTINLYVHAPGRFNWPQSVMQHLVSKTQVGSLNCDKVKVQLAVTLQVLYCLC